MGKGCVWVRDVDKVCGKDRGGGGIDGESGGNMYA